MYVPLACVQREVDERVWRAANAPLLRIPPNSHTAIHEPARPLHSEIPNRISTQDSFYGQKCFFVEKPESLEGIRGGHLSERSSTQCLASLAAGSEVLLLPPSQPNWRGAAEEILDELEVAKGISERSRWLSCAGPNSHFPLQVRNWKAVPASSASKSHSWGLTGVPLNDDF